MINRTIIKRSYTKDLLFNAKDFDNPDRNDIAKLAQNIRIPDVDESTFDSLLSFHLEPENNDYSLQTVKIPLATHLVFLIDDFFNDDYQDQEDYFAAHRFIWLYYVLSEYPHPKILGYCLDKIESWIDANEIPDKDKKFESYSISERLIAWIFFYQFTHKHIKYNKSLKRKILKSISSQVRFLANHLEYHGKNTNNHILNNARALYISGRLLKLADVETLGKKIFNCEYIKIIQEGIFQEGSSHYQFLITKNMLEMLIVADKTSDIKFKNLLFTIVSKMLFQCNILGSKYSEREIPFFGDISPDISPDWFIGEPFSLQKGIKSKWQKLFKYSSEDLIGIENLSKDKSAKSSKIKWLYLKKGNFEVWSILRRGKIPCHGHNDNGSLVMFHKGSPVIIDPGLSTYVNSTQKVAQIESGVHNVPTINSFPPDLPQGSLFKKTSVCSKASRLKIESSILEYSIIYAKEDIVLRRQIDLSKSSCSIADSCDNKHRTIRYQSSWVFICLPIQLEENKFNIENLNIEFQSSTSIQFDIDKIPGRSIQYGQLLPSFRIVATTSLMNSKFIITFTQC